MIGFIIKLIIAVGVILLALGFYRTTKTQSGAYQTQFLAGKVPDPAIDGQTIGSADFYTASWIGKKFSAPTNAGINRFKNAAGVESEKYPFKTSVGPGLRDTGTQVLKLDYDLPENPFWLRPVLDEVVEVAPGEYLGKMHYRLFGAYPFSIAYFKMKK